ncbi:DUF4974 domain-containing protein [Puteibacter caeruleilacunae]|nr:DUF4974 domain-containing protein [Puteibacter caeruleilacunae]
MKDLLNRYIKCDYLSADELNALTEMLHQKKNSKVLKSWLNEQWEEAPEIDVETSFESILRQIQQQKKQPRRIGWIKTWRMVAAVFLPALILSGIYWFSGNSVELIPGENYQTARGERKTIMLADSSIVKLDVASTLKIDPGYGQVHRHIELEGEASFHVVKNKSLPFVVTSRSIKTKALGTVFNVSAYPVEGLIKATLLEGCIQVSRENGFSELLEPGEELSYKFFDGRYQITKVSEEDINAVEEQKLNFDNAHFLMVARQIERYYDVVLRFQPKHFQNIKFSMKLRNETTLEELLLIMQKAIGFEYEIEEDQINLTRTTK